MSTLQEYKCPCCGGAIEFNTEVQKMKCPYCDTEFEMETLAAFDQDLKVDGTSDYAWDSKPGQDWFDGETEGMRVYICQSCGGEIVGDANTVATSCPFCSNPVVMMGQVSGILKPDLVIPFKLDKNAAKAAFEQHLTGKRLLPKIFKDENHIDEIRGIYVPFWLFDTKADADIRYRATRVKGWSDSKYQYTETNYYSVLRSGNLEFFGVPADGSLKMNDELMESLEPFDLSQAVDFQTAYLAGYFADKYDVTADESVHRANQRIKISTEKAFAETVRGYSTFMPESTNIRLNSGKVSYALLPVWILNTTWNGKKYTFAMNGQTGKFVGDLPCDKSLKNRLFWGITAGVCAAVMAVLYLIWRF